MIGKTKTISVIVPVLNEYRGLHKIVEAVSSHSFHEVIFVDGGSSDGTVDYLQGLSAQGMIRFLHSEAGRAIQMNAGANVASGEVLLFLHADTELPLNAKSLLEAAYRDGMQWGRFDIALRANLPRFQSRLNLVAKMMNWRSRWSKIATGDQAIFIQRSLFYEVGQYDQIPLMEDIAICKKLKKKASPTFIAEKVSSDGRRWEQQGWLKTVCLMWCLRLGYFFGVSPQRLSQWYRHVR